jgi:pimeloyl-ACP methyl ester carboxylesterase
VVIPSYLSQFNYQLTGPESGRKWVFLHGLMGYGANWRKITSGLESTERVLTYDQRGHGRSLKPMTGYASQDYADDLFLIVQELGWDKFILVGHSMGGRAALDFAHRFPEKLEKLIIEDIGPEGDMSAPQFYKDLLALVPTPFTSKLEAKEFFLNGFPGAARKLGQQGRGVENPETLGQYLYSNIEEKEAGKFDWRFSVEGIHQSILLGRAKDHWNELRSLSVETLVIRGGSSKELSSEVFQKMCLSNPRIRGVEISNAGHWVHSDQPKEFLRVIKEFVGMPL